MTAPDFPFNVGDKVRLKTRTFDWHVEITAIGRSCFLGVRSGASAEEWWDKEDAWELVPPTLKRYVVEHRPPKKGERCTGLHSVYEASSDGFRDDFKEDHRFVIVEELP